MEILNVAALLDIPSILDKMAQMIIVKQVMQWGVVMLKKMYPPFYSCFFPNVSLRDSFGAPVHHMTLLLQSLATLKVGVKTCQSSLGLGLFCAQPLLHSFP